MGKSKVSKLKYGKRRCAFDRMYPCTEVQMRQASNKKKCSANRSGNPPEDFVSGADHLGADESQERFKAKLNKSGAGKTRVEHRFGLRHVALLGALLATSAVHAETKDEWISLGARIHGGFGPFIPVGIRIGLDAMGKLHADPRGLTVTYYNGSKPPCPCIADGVMLATLASPGQGTLQISPDKAPDGDMAVIVIKNRKTGEGLKYTITDDWLPKILSWIKSDPSARYDSAMGAEGLFQVEPLK